MALLEELRAGFSDHDTVLHLLLGLVSLSRRLEPLLPEPPPGAPAQAPTPLAEADERRVLLLLGLVSVRRTLMNTLEPLRAAADAPATTEAPEPAAEPPSLRELLR
ncbi:hypothetical protein [Archangium sp.]|uniref:hypothetical protein n=1 Tax=Archangium sp. TaxID=1872627 RepID=UPI00286A9516|nr:hypothetical protein [Archangium sp.]